MDDKKPGWLDLESSVPLRSKRKRNAEQITGLSADHLKRHYPQYLAKSGDRYTMKVKHALAITNGEAEKDAA